jgi:hypothetical protein
MRLIPKGGPERWFMLGVVGLGAYAAYRLVLAPKGPSNTFDAVNPNATRAFAKPSDFTLPAGNTAALGDLVGLEQARWYGGIIDSGAPDYPGGTANAVLASYGFSPVTTFTDKASAAQHVPSYALATSSPTAVWFRAPFSLPTQQRPRPAWLPLLWATIAPTAATHSFRRFA